MGVFNVNLILYVNTQDKKEMFKGPTKVGAIKHIELKGPLDIVHPVFIFRLPPGQVLNEFNYVRLHMEKMTTDRWYFVKNVNLDAGGMVHIHCEEEDVRFTWRKDIMAQYYLVARQEFINDKTIQDDRKVIPMTRKIVSVGVSELKGSGVVGGGGDSTIILTVSG